MGVIEFIIFDTDLGIRNVSNAEDLFCGVITCPKNFIIFEPALIFSFNFSIDFRK